MNSARLFAASLLAAGSILGQTATDSPAEDKPKPLYQRLVITASPIDPVVDRRNSETINRTLFSRDDQVFHLLDAGISAGQHEGGGKSLEIRRFGFNLDHGGVNGGLKILVDDVPQNYPTQGHGQGYLGSLKSYSPELVQEVEIHNGPFRAEYGDFSGLGVVHILMRESLPDQFTARLQGGSFQSKRGFFGYSPDWPKTDAFLAYEGSHSDGPFVKPLDYRRDNLTSNWTRRINERTSLGWKLNAARNNFSAPGQLPLDEVAAGRLDRFGFLDAGDGGRVRTGTAAVYLRRETAAGAIWKLDGFVSRSLFDLYSNFTFYLNDPEQGDGIQQHDSRLQQGANAQYQRPHKSGGVLGTLTAGGNFHGNQNTVGLYSRVLRDPREIQTLAHANVANGAGYVQEHVSLWGGRIQAGGGLRYDVFRFRVLDLAGAGASGSAMSGKFQPKAAFSIRPSQRTPTTLHLNYGRGISSLDARGVVASRDGTRLATTDFYQAGVSHHWSRVSLVGTGFWIDRSHELVYIPDDGSIEFTDPSRALGYETKASVQVTSRLSLNAGATKVLNAYYRGGGPRRYVARAPHFTANAGLTLAGWRGWSASFRMRAINHYRVDEEDAEIVASGHTAFDFGLTRRLRRGIELQVLADNLLDRGYYETQNYFESRLPGQLPAFRIHGTPAYPVNVTVGLTFRFRGK